MANSGIEEADKIYDEMEQIEEETQLIGQLKQLQQRHG